MKEFSVIIPAHNEEEYISKTIESLNKSGVYFELIVVCDSCEDRTKEVAKNYTENVFEVNFKNVSKARNFGAKKSSSNILIFLDADTIVSDNYLSEIYEMTKLHDLGCARWASESKTILGKYITWASTNYSKKNIGGNFFIKRDLFEKVGGFNESMKKGEDTDLGERAKKLGANYIFMEKCFIIPSERRYRDNGYIKMIIVSGIWGLIYKFFRNYYNKSIADK